MEENNASERAPLTPPQSGAIPDHAHVILRAGLNSVPPETVVSASPVLLPGGSKLGSERETQLESEPTHWATKGPMWGYPVPVLGAISPFLEPFRGRLSPNIDNVSEN